MRCERAMSSSGFRRSHVGCVPAARPAVRLQLGGGQSIAAPCRRGRGTRRCRSRLTTAGCTPRKRRRTRPRTGSRSNGPGRWPRRRSLALPSPRRRSRPGTLRTTAPRARGSLRAHGRTTADRRRLRPPRRAARRAARRERRAGPSRVVSAGAAANDGRARPAGARSAACRRARLLALSAAPGAPSLALADTPPTCARGCRRGSASRARTPRPWHDSSRALGMALPKLEMLAGPASADRAAARRRHAAAIARARRAPKPVPMTALD